MQDPLECDGHTALSLGTLFIGEVLPHSGVWAVISLHQKSAPEVSSSRFGHLYPERLRMAYSIEGLVAYLTRSEYDNDLA